MNQGQYPRTHTAAILAFLREPSMLLGIGAAVGLFLSFAIIPGLGLVSGSFTPAPLIYHYSRRGRLFGLTMIGASFLVVTAIYTASGQIIGGLFFLEYCILAGLISEGIIWRLSPEKVVGIAAGFVIVLGLLVLSATAISQGQDPVTFGRNLINKQVTAAMQMSEAILTGKPLPEEPEQSLDGLERRDEGGQGPAPVYRGETDQLTTGPGQESEFKELARFVIAAFPALVVMGVVLAAWANFMLARRLLQKVGTWPGAEYDLKRWLAPDQLVWVVIGCGVGSFLSLGWIKVLCLNGLLVLGLIYFFQGLAIVAFWMERFNAPTFVRTIIYILVAFQYHLTLGVSALGLFDMWFDFRKIKRAAEGPPA